MTDAMITDEGHEVHVVDIYGGPGEVKMMIGGGRLVRTGDALPWCINSYEL
jgi:hypothetical protein